MSPKRKLTRRSNAIIASRRARVSLLDRFAFGPAQILELLRRDCPDLLGQADDYNTVIDDLRRIRATQRANLAKGIGIDALADYVGGLEELMRLAFLAHADGAMGDTARIAALGLALECRRDIGRAYGIPVDADPSPLGLALNDREFRLDAPDDIRLGSDDIRLEDAGLRLEE